MVSEDNSPAQTVVWTAGGGVTGTNISSTGLLSVAMDESAESLTVRATSTVDTGKSGTAAVTVTGGGGSPPGKLADSVTAEQALATVEAIIAYSGTPAATKAGQRKL